MQKLKSHILVSFQTGFLSSFEFKMFKALRTERDFFFQKRTGYFTQRFIKFFAFFFYFFKLLVSELNHSTFNFILS